MAGNMYFQNLCTQEKDKKMAARPWNFLQAEVHGAILDPSTETLA